MRYEVRVTTINEVNPDREHMTCVLATDDICEAITEFNNVVNPQRRVCLWDNDLLNVVFHNNRYLTTLLLEGEQVKEATEMPKMQRQILVESAKELPLAIRDMFFDAASVRYKGKELRASVLRGGLKKVIVGDFTYLQQNPEKNSRYGQLAREGHKILWIIHNPTNSWVGRVIDDEVTRL